MKGVAAPLVSTWLLWQLLGCLQELLELSLCSASQPNCHRKENSRNSVPPRAMERRPKDPSVRRGGDPRTLASWRHWLLQVIGTAGTMWVDGRMRRPVRLFRRTPGQARRGHFHQVLGMDWRVDATLGGLISQRADEILNSVFGPLVSRWPTAVIFDEPVSVVVGTPLARKVALIV